jgi:membrane fusion protein (multidrug efflux system)
MKRNIFVGIIIVIAVLAVLGGIKTLQIRKMIDFGKNYVPPPESIADATARTETWPDLLTAVGSVSAAQGVMVAPEIAGMVSEIHFESGATVKKGDLLLKLDTSTEEAQLQAAQAQSELAKLNAERTRKLSADKTVSQSELDSAEAVLKQNQANVDAIQAAIDKKNIRAPFDGKLGIRLVNLGEQLDVGKAIVSLQSLSPVFVDFSLPQEDLSQLKSSLPVRVTSDSYAGTNFDGKISAINPDLDATTRSVRVRATFANAQELLRPGMFVRVEVELPEKKNLLIIPATAMISEPYGDSVYLVLSDTNGGKNLTVQQKIIITGVMRGDFISVESGLQVGDRVATAGLFKLHNGSSVEVNNDEAPTPSLTPNPPNS